MAWTVDPLVFYEAEGSEDSIYEIASDPGEILEDESFSSEPYDFNLGEDSELYLLVIVRAKPPYEDGLALPGGHVEEGEQPEEAIPRELEEETGLTRDAITPAGELENLVELVFDPRYQTNRALQDQEPDFYDVETENDRSDQNFDYHAMPFWYQPDKDTNPFELEAKTDADSAHWVKIDEIPRMPFTQHQVVDHFIKELEL